jgi:hypothetical protein
MVDFAVGVEMVVGRGKAVVVMVVGRVELAVLVVQQLD